MRKPFAVAFLSCSFAFAIVVGCSAPSPDGTSLSRGRGSSGSSGDDADPEGDNSSNPAAGNCANHEKVDDRPACDQCARANCCEFILTCDKTPDCEALLKCVDDCKGDILCQYTCSISHERGGSVLSDVSACAKSKCASECPAADLDGGDLFGDAF
ncbi:MAG: hypothetical protein KF764_08470 [Labilithrix sp.]|nr:hypothetical protein [Labilithrix sp.]MBX3224290.1 hypothetical protein [Labilithrix sp.]